MNADLMVSVAASRIQEIVFILTIFIHVIVNILICPDKFKGSLTAKEVCNAVAMGISRIDLQARTELVPMADGGEGTCDLLTDWHHG